MNQQNTGSKIVIIAAIIGALATILAAVITKPTPIRIPIDMQSIHSDIGSDTTTTTTTIAIQDGLAKCTIKTGMKTFLYVNPDPFSPKLKSLTEYEIFQVFDIKKDNWNNYWFKVKDDNTEGWVMNFQCNSTSQACFD